MLKPSYATKGAPQARLRLSDHQDLLLLDFAPVALGVEAAGGTMVPLIARHAKIPAQRTMLFTTHRDNQPGMFIQVYEGDGVHTRNNHLSRFVLSGIYLAPRGVPQIEVTFGFDGNNNLVVSATDKGSEKSKRMSIADERRGLSKEMERTSADAEEHYWEPAKRMTAEKRLEEYASSVR